MKMKSTLVIAAITIAIIAVVMQLQATSIAKQDMAAGGNEKAKQPVQQTQADVKALSDNNKPPNGTTSEITQPQLSAQTLLEVDLTKEDQYYRFLLEHFPELKQEITAYRSSLAQQRKQLSDYQQQVANRNKQISQYGGASASLDSTLKAQRDRLLENAEQLGKQAQLLNQSIKLAAASYE